MSELDRVLGDVKAASRVLRRLSGAERDAVLEEMAEALGRRADEILRENGQDVQAAKRQKAAPALIDRLLLDEDRLADMAARIRKVRALPDPVGAVDGGRRLPNGLDIVRRRVPLGVVAVVFEGRPSVAADAAALCIKSGNAIILRGSRIARRSNLILAEVLTGALIEADAPRWGIALLGADRDELRRLVQREDAVDLVIPRGGEELKAFLREHARVPVVSAASENNHVYVDAAADLDMAVKVAVNAKVQRPGVCNAAETRAGLDTLGDAPAGLAEATEADYETEFLDLVMAVRVVDSIDEALEHIARHGSGHSEAIVTGSLAAAERFQDEVDAAAVYVNASTRFTDGGEFGTGAEIGISTQKLHARGQIGLAELTTSTYLVTGRGHVR